MAQSIRIKRTIVPDNPPAALADGELAVELNSAVPRLWVGVPTGIDATGRRQIVGDDVYLPLTGGTLSGPLTVARPPPADLGVSMVVAQTLTGAHSLSLNIYRNAGGGTSYVTDGAGVWLFLGNTVPDLGSLYFRMTEPGLTGTGVGQESDMLRLRPKWAEVGRTADLVIAPDNLSVGLTVLPPDAIPGVVSALGVEGVTHVEFNAYPGPAGISRYFYPAGVVAPAPGWPAALLDLDTVTATTRLTLRMAPPGVQGANIAWTDICNWGLDGGGRGYLDLASHGSYLNNQVVVRHPGGEVLRAETPSGTDSHFGFSNIDRHWEIGLQGFASPGQFWIYDRTRNALCIAIATNGDCYNNTGSWQSLSDPRVKTDISEYTSGLDQMLALQPIAYRYNGRGGIAADSPEVTRYGLDAAATRAVMPELVGQWSCQQSRDDAPAQLLTIDSGPLIYALVNAVKELAANNTALATRVAALGG